MKPKFSPRQVAQAKKTSPVVSRAYKPFLIGSVIKTVMEEQHKKIEDVAKFMDVDKRTVRNWLVSAFLPVPIILKLSEFFNKNLMLQYHPDVDDPENPLAPVVAKLQKEKEELLEVKEELREAKEEILKLEGKLEEAEKIIGQFRVQAR